MREPDDSINNLTALTRGGVGRMTAVTTPMQEKATYEYDTFNHITTAIDPNGKQTLYSYDLMSNVTSNQTNIQYSYDGLDRVAAATDTGGGTPTSQGNTRSFYYDLLDNLLAEKYLPEGGSVTCTINGSQVSTTACYTYDLASREKSVQTNGQAVANYTLDNNNRLTNAAQGTLAAGWPTTAPTGPPACRCRTMCLPATRMTPIRG